MNIVNKIVQSIRGIDTERQDAETVKEKAIVRNKDGSYKEECNYDHR